MINRLQMNNFLEPQESKILEGPQREAKKYLDKITILQEKLNIEEKNLKALLKTYGLGILGACL